MPLPRFPNVPARPPAPPVPLALPGGIYTVAGNGTAGFAGDGGPATSAEFHNPDSVAVGGAGNIAVADTVSGSVPADMGNNRVRVVAAATGEFYGVPMTAGDVYTVAGNGTQGYSGTAARPQRPSLTSRSGWAWTPRATWWSPTCSTAGSGRSPASRRHRGSRARGLPQRLRARPSAAVRGR